MRGKTYYAFRYFVIPTEQMSIHHLDEQVKKRLILNIIERAKHENIYHIIRGRKYILCFNQEIGEGLYLFKFGVQRLLTKHDLAVNDIQTSTQDDYPFVYLIIDTFRQIVLIQKNTSVFDRIGLTKLRIEQFMQIETIRKDYYFSLDEITYSSKFWEYIEGSTAIYSVGLSMKSPNLFGGRSDANEFLKDVKGIYNNTDIDINLRNKKGKLKIVKENLDNFIKYITAGGGKWSLRVFYNSRKQTLRSNASENIKTVIIEGITNQQSETLDREVKDKIASIDEIFKDTHNHNVEKNINNRKSKPRRRK